MEYFPASNSEQWKYIKKLISQCDYYLVIISGKYGSLDEKGVSYTQKEYEYAVKCDIPVAAILYKNIDELKRKQTETDPEKCNKLKKFRSLVQERLCSYYQNKYELAYEAGIAIQNLIRDYPREGWIKNSFSKEEDVKNEFSDLDLKQPLIYINKMYYGMSKSIDQALSKSAALSFIQKSSQYKSQDTSIRNQLLISASYVASAKPRELNDIKIKDIMNSDGSLKRYCLSKLSANSPSRILFINNHIFTNALNRYINYRKLSSSQGSEKFNGLNPNEPLFLSRNGTGFAKKLTKSDGNSYSSTSSIGQLLRKIHMKHCKGREGVRDSGRKTIYALLKRNNTQPEVIAVILGYIPANEVINNNYLLRKCYEAMYTLYD